MEKELNISAILKDKPVGTKLWSPVFGNCVFSRLSGSGIRVFPIHNGFTAREEKSFFVTGQYTLPFPIQANARLEQVRLGEW